MTGKDRSDRSACCSRRRLLEAVGAASVFAVSGGSRGRAQESVGSRSDQTDGTPSNESSTGSGGSDVARPTAIFQGNLVLEGFHNDRSFLFTVEVGGDGVEELRMVPVQIRDETVRRGSEAASWARSRMRRRSRAFGTELGTEGNELVPAL